MVNRWIFVILIALTVAAPLLIALAQKVNGP
jgi:hypothetical protein